MIKNLVIVAFVILSSTNSCVKKQEKTLAIDVLLTLPEDIYRQAIELNAAILQNNPNNFTLDDNHIPHITLVQCIIKEKDLPKVEQLLEGIYKTIAMETLHIDGLQYIKERSESFASIGIKKSEPLLALHEKIIALLKPYMIDEGSQQAYVQNSDGSPIDEFTIAYVPKFVSEHSYANYNPHISMGVADTSLLDNIGQHTFRSVDFRATSVSVYQLGASGTAQKLLWKSK